MEFGRNNEHGHIKSAVAATVAAVALAGGLSACESQPYSGAGCYTAEVTSGGVSANVLRDMKNRQLPELNKVHGLTDTSQDLQSELRADYQKAGFDNAQLLVGGEQVQYCIDNNGAMHPGNLVKINADR